MQFRNPAYNEHGTIDCEINHSQYGWIPHTIPADENPQLQAAAIQAGPVPYTPTPAPAIAIAAWRANAVASKMQIRFALLQMGLLATVQAMADADPYASIAWEYADHIERNSPFIDGLKGEAFTDAQIDDIFRFAMGV